MWKFLITLSIVSVLGSVLGEELNSVAENSVSNDEMEICKTEVGATDTDLKQARELLPASTKEGKCLRACYMKKTGVMDSNGKYIKSAGLKAFEELTEGDVEKTKTLHEIIDTCGDLAVSDDHCEAADQYGTCFRKQFKESGLLGDVEL